MGFLAAICFTSETKLGQGPFSSSSSNGVLCFKAIPFTSLNNSWKIGLCLANRIYLNLGSLTSSLIAAI